MDVEVDPDVNFDWSKSFPLPAPFSVEWTGRILIDPAGDYTWAMFHKADSMRPGTYETLSRKAQQLFGGPNPALAPAVPRGRNATAFHLETHTVDIYLQYCSGREGFLRDSPSFVVVDFPPELAVGADYGLTLLNGASAAASSVAAFFLSPEGQKIFGDAGFQAVSSAR